MPRHLTAGLLLALLASSALAQTQQKSGPVYAPAPAPAPRVAPAPAPAAPNRASSTTSGPEFRDPKTGQVWTPDNVGQDNKGPVAPEDRAFDPSGQAVASGTIVDQSPRAQRIGTVPITAGPTVPLVVLENMVLNVVPGDHWLITVDLTNNSANTYDPTFVCHFDNAGQVVSRVRALVPTTGPGERLRLTVVGPATTLFVNHAGCDLTSP